MSNTVPVQRESQRDRKHK